MSFKEFGIGPILVSIIWGILLSLVLVLLLYFLWKICKQEDRIHYFEQYKQTVTRSSQSHRQTNILVSYNSQQQQAEIPQDAQNINSNQQQPEVLQHYISRKKQEIVTVETDDEDIDNIPTFETDRENKENIFYHEEDEVKLPAKILLTQDAISKHIDPKCFTDKDAIRKFKKREKRHGPTDVNTVFRVKPNEFYVARSSSHEEVSQFLTLTFWTKQYIILGHNISASLSILAM